MRNGSPGMADACLIDATILVYTMDDTESEKRQHCLRLVKELAALRIAALTTQTLGEFFNAVTRRLRDPLSQLDALSQLAAYADAFPVYDITLPIVLEAARGAHQHQMSYWDAQVWATAKLNQIPCVLTENMQGRGLLEGVRFVNPLAEGFDLSILTGRR